MAEAVVHGHGVKAGFRDSDAFGCGEIGNDEVDLRFRRLHDQSSLGDDVTGRDNVSPNRAGEEEEDMFFRGAEGRIGAAFEAT